MESWENEILERVLPEDYLKLSNGEIVRSLNDLVEALKEMSDEDFGLHVYSDQNDFAEWILEAYWNDWLTEKVLGIRNRKKLIKFLMNVLEKAREKKKKSSKIVAPNKKVVLKKIAEIGDV